MMDISQALKHVARVVPAISFAAIVWLLITRSLLILKSLLSKVTMDAAVLLPAPRIVVKVYKRYVSSIVFSPDHSLTGLSHQCASSPGHAFDSCEEAYGACMQTCGSLHPNAKRDLGSDLLIKRDGTNSTLVDIGPCLSAFSFAAGIGNDNITLGAWELFTLLAAEEAKRYFIDTNITDFINNGIAKFQAWDTNGDGVLTFLESMTVQQWP